MLQRLKDALAPAFFYAFAGFIALAGGVLLALGASLWLQGGSPFYIVSGALLVASGVQLFRKRKSAIHIAALNFILTWLWALAEVGADGWALLPRVDFITVVLPFYWLPTLHNRLAADCLSARLAWANKFWPALPAFVLGTGLWISADALKSEAQTQSTPRTSAVDTAPTDWRFVSGSMESDRFSSLSEIKRTNVKGLKRAWEHVEPVPAGPSPAITYKEQAAPLQVKDQLFTCLSDNTLLALDAEDGSLRWRYDPRSDLQGVTAAACRGVAYFEDSAAPVCSARIIAGTMDARLIAVDAQTGKPCRDFGENGAVSLKEGMGPFEPGTYYVTSPPVVTRGLVIVGGLVADNMSLNEPSGVIRAFNARTGRLVWAWDMGRPNSESGAPPKGKIYTPGTPNAWSLFSADEALGLVYLPTGNATPDFVGAHRRPDWEKYSSSVVALEATTGKVRWSFQMVHHDLWDYDASAQPVLFDMPTSNGSVPAVVQASKQGDLFVLDRRTGKPLSSVVEKPVPQTDVPDEQTSKSQPFSVDMPSLSGPPLKEADMWGISPFDQLMCRLKFRQLRYEGAFTPPSTRGSLQYPGQAGGVDWGSMAVDGQRQIMFVPSFRLATMVQLVSRSDVEKGARISAEQKGAPYAAYLSLFMTRLGVPCQQPPYAMLTAIDLRSKSTLWSKPIGTAEELGPLGIASHLPFTIGAAPMVGGAIATAGDLVFIGATGDRRLRAIDSLSGRELWSDKLPQGNQATPITYRAPRSGRQMVVFVSGNYAALRAGRPRSPVHIIAYALP